MLDVANVLDLCPKVSATPFSVVKKNLGEAQASATKKKPKRKLVLHSFSDKKASESSVSLPITLPTKKKSRTIKIKAPKKTNSVVDIPFKALIPSSPTNFVPIIQVFSPIEPQPAQPIQAQPIFVVLS